MPTELAMVLELRFRDGTIVRLDVSTPLSSVHVTALETGTAKLVGVTSAGDEIVLADIHEVTEELNGMQR